jgi:hypothetical protein
MDWQEELQIEVIERNLKVAEAFDLLVSNLTKDELEEFAGELIKWCELSGASLLE